MGFLTDGWDEVKVVAAERDQLRAEVERLRAEVAAMKEDGFFGRMAGKLATEKQAAESTASGLRRALEEIRDNSKTCAGAQLAAHAALAASTDDHARHIKAEALREAVEEARNDEAAQESAATTRGALLCIAARLEATNGR